MLFRQFLGIARDSISISQLEKVLTLMARLGNNSEFGSRLQQLVIDIRKHVPPDDEVVFTAAAFI